MNGEWKWENCVFYLNLYPMMEYVLDKKILNVPYEI
jgi:hypothetical protein